MRLNVKSFAVTCGLIWGIGIFLMTWWIMAFDGATDQQTLIGMVYRGYTISPIGSLLGLVWGTVDGFIGGAIFAWVYNALVGAPMFVTKEAARQKQPTAVSH